MIALNLLSPEQKQALKQRVVYAKVEYLMLTLVATSLVVTVAIFGVKMQLKSNLDQMTSGQLLAKNYADVNGQIKQFNTTVKRLDAVQQQALPVSNLLHEIAKKAPKGIQLTTLSFDARSGELNLSGAATTRESLLAYEAALRGSPMVKSLESPLSNLLLKTNINFNFSAVIDLAVLQKTLDAPPL